MHSKYDIDQEYVHAYEVQLLIKNIDNLRTASK